jgi:succinoglycan biosynthesis transport protein ExoP
MRINTRQRSVIAAPPAAPVETLYESAQPQSYETPGLSITQIAMILRSHLKISAIILVSIIVLASVVIKLLPKAYTSTASMMVSYRVNQGGTEIPSWLITTYLATQVELMRSTEVLLPVVDQLNLDKDSEFIRGFRGGDEMALRNYAAESLDKHLTIEPGRGSQLLYLSATSRSPVKAAQLANAVADMYSKRERQRLKDPADDRAREYSLQLAELQAKVTAAQQKVTELRQQTGISPINNVNTSGPDVDSQTLASLEQQLLAAQNLRRAAETATNLAPVGANGGGEGSPQIKALNAEISNKELQLSQLSATYGARHPKVLELRSDLAQARQNLRSEQRNYLNDTRQIEAKLQQAVDAERQRILNIRKVQDQEAKLQLELESTQSVYKRALDGYDQIMFASSGNPTNVSFVSRAAIPTEASKPNKVKLFLLGIFAAIFCGTTLPVIYELLFDRRLHCRDDFERHFSIPVLAEFGPAFSLRARY